MMGSAEFLNSTPSCGAGNFVIGPWAGTVTAFPAENLVTVPWAAILFTEPSTRMWLSTSRSTHGHCPS